MANWYEDNSFSIGRTPLVKINKITQGAKATVFAKIEGQQPGIFGEVPHRRIDDLGRGNARRLYAGKEIIEPTSGNTGIALAFVGAARGYKLTLTMPETMSIERRKVLAALGADMILTPARRA